MPLDVDKGIELPQLELISTKNDDCTTVYSTGNCNNGAIRQLSSLNLSNQYLYRNGCKCRIFLF